MPNHLRLNLPSLSLPEVLKFDFKVNKTPPRNRGFCGAGGCEGTIKKKEGATERKAMDGKPH
jgi:hypothetical protein